jgi:HEAT repeat protein
VSQNRVFKEKLAALDALRSEPATVAGERLGKALKDRNNYLVARAASLCAGLHLDGLIPDLLTAFERFFQDPVKSDPQCLAKNAIAAALRDLAYHVGDPYVRGIGHVQFEPTWGGRADTAATLRGTCALALSECPLDDLEILTYLADALADPDRSVRVDAARAIEQLNRTEGALLLRLKLLLGDVDPTVMGQCFESMLSLAPDGGLSFVSRFLKSESADVQLEAASALAQCRDPHAISILREFWQDPLLPTDLRQALLINLGASPQREATDLLLEVVSREPMALASTAIKALATSRYRAEIRPILESSLAERDSSALQSLFTEAFAPVAPSG